MNVFFSHNTGYIKLDNTEMLFRNYLKLNMSNPYHEDALGLEPL